MAFQRIQLPARSVLLFEVIDRTGNVAYRALGLFRLPSGLLSPFQFDFVGTGANGLGVAVTQVPEGELLALDVRPLSQATSRGDAWCRVSLAQGVPPTFVRSGTIGSGYITLAGTSWNFLGQGESPLSGFVSSRTFTVASPAAGADWTFTPAQTSWQAVHSVSFRLVTSAVVVTRQVSLLLFDPIVAVWVVQAQATQLATQTRDYCFAAWGVAPASRATEIQGFLPPGGLGKNMTMNSTTSGLDVGDQFSNIRIFGTECRDPN
jgi:hypothetical protein